MKRAWRAAPCLLACIGLLNGTLAQQPSDGLLTVRVQITDQSERPVAGLQLKDFMVLENSRTLEIRTFAKGEGEGAYIIGYFPARNPNGGYRPIEVRVALPNVHVRVRVEAPASK